MTRRSARRWRTAAIVELVYLAAALVALGVVTYGR